MLEQDSLREIYRKRGGTMETTSNQAPKQRKLPSCKKCGQPKKGHSKQSCGETATTST